MILWTLEPFDRIFPTEISRNVTLGIGAGFIEGRFTPEGFSVERLCSTDLRDYLNKEYAPGYLRKN